MRSKEIFYKRIAITLLVVFFIVLEHTYVQGQVSIEGADKSCNTTEIYHVVNNGLAEYSNSANPPQKVISTIILGIRSVQWSVVGGTIVSGQGTVSLKVQFQNQNCSITADVLLTDGTEVEVTKTIVVNSLPPSLGTISGSISVVKGAASSIYSVTANPKVTRYTWSVPAGATIESGLNTNSITVKFSQTAVSGNISVYPVNGCGNGPTSNLAVNVSAPSSAISYNSDWNSLGNAGTNPSENFIGTTDAKDLVFRTRNTEQMRINNSGRVGIGSSNPSYMLDIVSNGVDHIRLSRPSAKTELLIGNDFFNLQTQKRNWRMVIGPLNNGFEISQSFDVGGHNWMIPYFLIKDGGNVGIGTPSPQAKLDVNGEAIFRGRLLMNYDNRFIVGYGNDINSRFEIVSSLEYKHTYIDFKKNLYFRAADQSWICPLVLQWDGNVGIGFNPGYAENATHTQGYKLAVNGGILCEEVKVITDVPNSDYVFNSNYKLFNLNELEAFVKVNKHLPEVPSAEEFRKNGYKVGEMDDLLLRKVEELTLYIIELNKKIEEMEKKTK